MRSEAHRDSRLLWDLAKVAWALNFWLDPRHNEDRYDRQR